MFQMTKDEGLQKVEELVEAFQRDLGSFKRPAYKEARLRSEFIDPFFEALGWDVHNKSHAAPAYKDVILEDAIKVAGTIKAPDYCFRIGPQKVFFVEAKKPVLDLKKDPRPAYQLRRYGWSANLKVSILTDFEEFAVYDCRVRPKESDKVGAARVQYHSYEEYLDRFDELHGLFGREAVLQGSLERFAEEKKLRGTAPVDKEFLKEIETWRDVLARNIALRNKGLSVHEMNFAVQRTIDRIIFLRICEDRGIESYGKLESCTNGANVYERLMQLFDRAEERYNSGIFHFEKEKGQRTEPDTLTPHLKIDDSVLKKILKGFYYPASPYEFSVLGADILGQVYEQFLGKVIRLTPGGYAKVEEKPEVRKAGGVYYTPTYIVDYIVKNTVGKLCHGDGTGKSMKPLTPRQVHNLRILDPACGSGSFLIGAFQYLLDYIRDWYVSDGPEKHKDKIYQGIGGQWFLATAEKKQLLLNCIYGVDIDSQAVEVTKLNLLLKALEGESKESIKQQLQLFQERALPDLGDNIKCGNSLIGTDFYQKLQMNMLDIEEHYRINAFDWECEYSEISIVGGFDAVIGNPPYGFHQIHSRFIKPYFKDHYVSSCGSFEHYFLFYERSLKLLRKNGYLGFIAPVTWLTIPSAYSLRRFILDNYKIEKISWLPELVFTNAQVNTLVSIIKNANPGKVQVNIFDLLGFKDPPVEKRVYKQSHFKDSDHFIGIFEKEHDIGILQKITLFSQPLKDIARPCSGYNPYEVGKGKKPQGGPHTKETVETKPYHSNIKLSSEWKPEIVGRDLDRYSLNITGKRWIKYGPWLAAPRDPRNFIGERILVQEITGGKEKRIVATYYDKKLFHSRDVIPIKIENELPSPFYLLGIINSKLITWYHHIKNPKAQKGLFPKVLVSDLKNLPIHLIDFSNAHEKAKHDEVTVLVKMIIKLHENLAIKKEQNERIILQRQIEATDRQIDQLVYELYGLTDEEIRIVEESTKM